MSRVRKNRVREVGKWKIVRRTNGTERTMEDSEEETPTRGRGGEKERGKGARNIGGASRLRASIARLLDGRWRVGGEGRYLRERRLGRNIV